MVYVVPACHFNGKDELCKTTIARLEYAQTSSQRGDIIMVTGDVPYQRGGRTLAELMESWLINKGVPVNEIVILKGGVGTFSEARIACNRLKSQSEMTVISSNWYLWQGQPIWRRRGKENNIKISFMSVTSTGGWRTMGIYGLIALTVHLAISLGLEGILERHMTTSQQSRRQGFTFNGCA